MLIKKRLSFLVLALMPVALFFAMRAKLSWRPRVLGQMKGEITALAWSPDGKWLASASGDAKTWNVPAEICVWSVPQGKLQSRFAAKNAVQTLRFSSDSQELVGIAIAQKLHRWDWKKGTIKSTSLAKALAVSDDAKMVANIARGGVAIHSVPDGKRISFFKDPRGVPRVAAFSEDGKKLALFCAQSSHAPLDSVQIWRIQSGLRPLKIFTNLNWAPQTLQFMPDDVKSRRVFSSSPVGFNNMLVTPEAICSSHALFAFSADKAVYRDVRSEQLKLLKKISLNTERELKSPTGQATFQAIAFSPDGAILVGGDDKGFITLWRIK